MLEIVLVVSTFGLFFLSVRLAGLIPFPTGIILIIGLSQAALLLIHYGADTYSMASVFSYGGLKQNYTFTEMLYSCAAVLSLCMVTGKFGEIKAIRLDPKALQGILNSARLKRTVTIAVTLLAAHLTLFAILTDWNKLWFYQVYLQSVASSDMVQLLGFEFASTVMRTTPFWALLSVLCVCLLMKSRSLPLKFITRVMALCYFLILLSFHSRTAAFVPGLMGVYYVVLRPRGRAVIMTLMWVMTFLAITSALSGRGTNEHGLSTVAFSLVRPFVQKGSMDIDQIILNFFEGIFVTAESFQVKGEFAQMYKILAYSPLPSLIDGYSSIQAKSEHRLHDYVPMSGIGEAVKFGWSYVFLLVLVVALVVRTHLLLIKNSPIIFIMCNFLIMFSCYLLFSYPLRNALRFSWLAFGISVVVMLFRRRAVPGVDEAPAAGAPQDGRRPEAVAVETKAIPAFSLIGRSRRNPNRHKCFKS